jgi:hypothetical protein
MWHEVKEFDYSSVPEGKRKVRVCPATDPNAQLLIIEVVCEHYEWYGNTQARFRLVRDDDELHHLDLADYVVTHWSDIDE